MVFSALFRSLMGKRGFGCGNDRHSNSALTLWTQIEVAVSCGVGVIEDKPSLIIASSAENGLIWI